MANGGFNQYPYVPQQRQFIPPGTTDFASNAFLALLLGIQARADENRRQQLEQQYQTQQQQAFHLESLGKVADIGARVEQAQTSATQRKGLELEQRIAAENLRQSQELFPTKKTAAESEASTWASRAITEGVSAKEALAKVPYIPELLKNAMSKSSAETNRALADATTAQAQAEYAPETFKDQHLRAAQELATAQFNYNQAFNNANLVADELNAKIEAFKAQTKASQTSTEAKAAELQFSNDTMLDRLKLSGLLNQAKEAEILQAQALANEANAKTNLYKVQAAVALNPGIEEQVNKINTLIKNITSSIETDRPNIISLQRSKKKRKEYIELASRYIKQGIVITQGLGVEAQKIAANLIKTSFVDIANNEFPAALQPYLEFSIGAAGPTGGGGGSGGGQIGIPGGTTDQGKTGFKLPSLEPLPPGISRGEAIGSTLSLMPEVGGEMVGKIMEKGSGLVGDIMRGGIGGIADIARGLRVPPENLAPTGMPKSPTAPTAPTTNIGQVPNNIREATKEYIAIKGKEVTDPTVFDNNYQVWKKKWQAKGLNTAQLLQAVDKGNTIIKNVWNNRQGGR